MVAAKIANLPVGANQHEAEGVGISTGSAAGLLNVSRDSVQKARVVQREGAPELVEAVEQGKVAVSTAAEIARAIAQPPARDSARQVQRDRPSRLDSETPAPR